MIYYTIREIGVTASHRKMAAMSHMRHDGFPFGSGIQEGIRHQLRIRIRTIIYVYVEVEIEGASPRSLKIGNNLVKRCAEQDLYPCPKQPRIHRNITESLVDV